MNIMDQVTGNDTICLIQLAFCCILLLSVSYGLFVFNHEGNAPQFFEVRSLIIWD